MCIIFIFPLIMCLIRKESFMFAKSRFKKFSSQFSLLPAADQKCICAREKFSFFCFQFENRKERKSFHTLLKTRLVCDGGERERKGKINFWCVGCLSLLLCADSNSNDVVMSPKNFSFTESLQNAFRTQTKIFHFKGKSFSILFFLIAVVYSQFTSNIIRVMMMLYNVFCSKIFLWMIFVFDGERNAQREK